MNKADLIEAITEQVGDKRTASNAVEAVVAAITRAVSKGEKVAISGFGVFEKVDRAARVARNPATGATVRLKKTSVPKFRPGQNFKDVVSGAKKLAPLPKKAAPAKVAAKAPAKRAVAVKAPAKVAAKAPAKRAVAVKAPAKVAAKVAAKAPAKKAVAVKAPAKVAVKAPAKVAAKAPAKVAAKVATKVAAKAPAKKAPAKKR